MASACPGWPGLACRPSLLVLCITLTMAVVSACDSVPDAAGDRVGGGEHDEASNALGWAGFTDITGLELVEASGEAGIDTLEMFLLRGSAEQVDRALEAAGFDAPPANGMRVAQPPLEAFDPEGLDNVVSGEDRRENAAGRTLRRLYVRGEASGGQHVLHVWAFTT